MKIYLITWVDGKKRFLFHGESDSVPRKGDLMVSFGEIYNIENVIWLHDLGHVYLIGSKTNIVDVNGDPVSALDLEARVFKDMKTSSKG